MSYILIGILIIGIIYLWLTETVKRAVVQPVGKDGKLIGPLFSEKPRWKLIKEEYGIQIGFWLAIFIGGLCWVLLP